jgi:hypothetical protein
MTIKSLLKGYDAVFAMKKALPSGKAKLIITKQIWKAYIQYTSSLSHTGKKIR